MGESGCVPMMYNRCSIVSGQIGYNFKLQLGARPVLPHGMGVPSSPGALPAHLPGWNLGRSHGANTLGGKHPGLGRSLQVNFGSCNAGFGCYCSQSDGGRGEGLAWLTGATVLPDRTAAIGKF